MNSTAGVSCERESVQVARVCVTAAVLLALAALLVQPETGRAAVLRDERGNVQGLGRTHALTESDLGKRISVGVTLADGGFSQMITSARTGPVKRAPATGRPDISGNLRVGETLTAVTGGIHDRDGLDRTAFSYQWLADDVAIANATGETYTLTAAEQGKRIKLTVTFTDNVGAAESVTSLARGPVVAAGVQNQAPTGLPVISGTVQVGYALTADTSGIGDADGLTGAEFTYQWLRNDALLAGETGIEYLVKASDSGHRLKARVYFRDDRGTPETLTSAATVTIPDAPSQGDVQLEDAVLLFFYNGRWGTVCDKDTDHTLTQRNRVVQVVCRQLGRTGGEYVDNVVPIASPIVDEAICQGTESTLSACSFTTNIHCSNAEAFGIRCTDETGPGDNTYVVIVGEARVGEVLTVNFDWASEEEPDVVSIVYEWLVDNVAVTGETASTYTVRATDLGKRMKVGVTVTFTTPGPVSFESPETNPVQPASATLRPNQRPVGVPVITGDARVGRTLTADTSGISDSDGPATLVFSYEWSSDGVAVSTRTASTYTVRAVDEGKSIGVSVSYTDARDFGHTLTSAGTGAVLPSNRNPSGKPEVIGSPKVGNTLTADTSGISDPDGPSTPSFTYQWLGDDQPITGALSATYTLLAAQLGQGVKVRVSFTDGAGNTETLTSPATVTVLAANTANQRPSGTLTVSLSGSWQVNKGTLTVGQGEITDPDGPGDLVAALLRPASYEWVADGDVAGTGLSFPLTPEVAGKRITLRVSFTDSAGVNETFSSTPGGPVYWRVSATGQPGITGVYRVGDTLTATTTGIVEPDGIDETSFAYEWIADETAIANATSSTYMLTANELNKRITVRVSFNDRAGDSEVLTSLATGPVRAVGAQDQPATGTVTVRGMPRLGGTLTAVTDGVSDPDGLSSVRFAFQWLADNVAISGATGRTHALTGSDLGKRISVRVTFADDGGFSQMITSAQTGPVTSIPATGRPDTSGILRVGETLTAVTGGIHDRDGLDRTAFSYQWLADDVAIANATGETYTLTAAEQGKRIKLTVTFTDNVGAAESVTSLARGPVVAAGVQNQAPTGLPVISGTVQVGYALTAGTSGIGDADGLTSAEFTYQWLRNDALLVGETGIEYLVKASDSGHLLKVRVYFTDDRGTQETLTSAATVAVPNAPSQGDVQLEDAVLLFFYNGRWGTVCDKDTDHTLTQRNRVVQVVCRQLGRTGGEYVDNVVPIASPIVDEAICQGTESTLSACSFTTNIHCSNAEAFGIRCTDETGPGDNTYVVIVGEARVREVLTANFDWASEEDAGVVSIVYEWLVDNVPVTGETASTYTVRATDLGKRMKVGVTVTFTTPAPVSFDSPETNPVQPASNGAPVGVPVILGVVAVGQTLTADTSALSDPDGPATLVFSYQWSSDGEAVTGRTASTYVVRGLDTRKSLTVEVSYTDGAGKEERITSEPTVAVPIGTQSQVTALTVAFGVESADVMEGGSPLQVTVALSGPAGGTLTVSVEAKAGGTAAAADYSIVPATLTFAYGESSKTLEVGAVDDDVDEGDETVVLGFGTLPPGLSAGSVGTLTVTLGDNDERGVVVRKQNVVVTEGGSEEYGVVLESEPEGAVTVTVGVPEGTDVSVSPSALTFTAADWQTAQTFTVSAAEDDGDAQVDADVELGHTVSGGDYGGVSASGVTVRISENDRPAVAIADARGMESVGTLEFAVSLDIPSSEVVTVGWATADGTAVAGTDYESGSGSLTFMAGETAAQVIGVKVLDDGVDEAEEGFGVNLMSPVNGVLGDASAEGRIEDNDERGVVVSAAGSGVTVDEGESAEYGVVLESEPVGAVTVTVGVPEGTDVSVSPSALTFTAADWQTAQTFTVSAAEDDGDAQTDADVELGHTVSGGDYGGVSASGVTVRISENDRPAVAIADARGMESVGTLEFAVSLDIPSSEVVTVGWATADGTAVAGTDYESGSGSLTFMAGETAAQVIGVKVLDDGVDEEEEGFGVNLMSPVNGVLGDASAEGRIEDNDERGVVVSAAGSGVTVDEGGSAEYGVVLESEPVGTVTVTVGVPEGTDVSVSPSALTFTAADWQTAQTFTVSAAEDDGDAQADADVELGHTVSGGDYGGVSASGVTVRISENDRPAVAIADARGMESVGTLEFAVSLDIPSSEVVTVGWATADGTAVAGTDYESGSGSLTFMAGETAAQVIGVKVLDDGVDEEEEGFGVNLTSPVNGVLGDASAEGRIEDNDERGVVVSAAGSGVTVDEGESAEYGVVLESEPVGAVTVTVRVPEGTDVSVSPSALTFTAADWGEAQTFTVSAANDDVKDAVEVELGHAVSGGDYGAVDVAGVVVRVIDNDEPTLAVTDAVGGESEGERVMRFVVSLSLANLNEAVTVDWATADGTAVAGMDYEGGSGSLTFAAGDVESRTIEVVVKDDGVDEEEEGFSVELKEARNASIGDESGAGRIADDDERGVTVSSEGLTVEEGGSGEYTVVLESDPEGPVTVAVRVPEGTDVGVSPVGLTFTAADWQTVQTITVSAAEDDGDAQTDAEVELVHLVSGGGYGGESASSVTVRITENDQPTVRIAPSQAAEGAGAMRFAVSLDIPSSREVVVGYETAAGTAEAGADYVETSGSLTFPAGETADEVEVVLRDDDVDEDPVAGAAVAETITVRLRDAENAVLGQEASVEGRIVDDDERGVTVSRERLTVTEGGSESYAVMLESEPEGEVTVAVRVPGGTDVRVSPLALTFTAADWSARQRVTVHAVEDADAEAEPAVSLTHEVSGGDYAGASAAEVRVTVIENDEPTLVVADAEGLENEGFLEFVVGLSTTSSQDVVVAYETRDGTAEAGSDYAAVSGSLTFAAGGNEAQTITVRVLNDEEAETTETFALELRQPVNARLGDASADGRIVDDDDEARATLGGELRTAADGGVVLAYEEARGPVVRLEVAAMADGVNGLDRDRDGEVEEAERPRVRKLSPQELPAVPARLRVRVEADTAVDIEVPGGGSGLAARVCLATGLEGEGLAVYRYDTGTAEWERLESEVEESGGQRYVCADVEGFSVFAVFEEAATELSDADVNEDGEVNEDDALVMYYAYALSGLVGDGEGGGVARFRRTLLGPRAGSADASDAELMAMVRRANAWREVGADAGGDVNGDGRVDGDDGLVMYYAYTLGSLLGDGQTGGVERFRRTLLGGRARSSDPSDAELMTMLRRANDLSERFGSR